MEKKLKIAGHVGTTVWGEILRYFDVYQIKVGNDKRAEEFHCFIGFVSAASDVLCQSEGAKPGGMASSNAALSVFKLFLPDETMIETMQITFDLHETPDEYFGLGMALGADFGNAIFAEDTSTKIAVAKSYIQLPKLIAQIEASRKQ